MDKENLDSSKCDFQICKNPENTAAYIVWCEEEHTLTQLLRQCRSYKLIFICMYKGTLNKLYIDRGKFSLDEFSLSSTIVAFNQTTREGGRGCPLYDERQAFFGKEDYNVTLVNLGKRPIPPPTSLAPSPANVQLTFYFVMFAFCLLLLLAVVWFIFNYIKRCHQMVVRRHRQVHEQSVTRKAINKCPVKAYKKSKLASSALEASEDADRCAICLEDYKVKDSLRELPCKHLFHKVCVDPWLLEKRTCPLCKKNIVSECQEQTQVTTNVEMVEQSLETVYEVDEEAEVASSSFAEEQQTQSSVTGTISVSEENGNDN